MVFSEYGDEIADRSDGPDGSGITNSDPMSAGREPPNSGMIHATFMVEVEETPLDW
jgi:hypothetical protein